MAVTLVNVSLATIGIESFLYGIFFILFFISLYLLVFRGHSSDPDRTFISIFKSPLVSGSIGMFLCVTAHWITTFYRLFRAWTFFADRPIEFYGDLTQTSQVVKTGTLIGSLFFADSLMIYRLWIVWGYNTYVVIFPIGLLVGLITSGIGITYQFAKFTPGSDVFTSAAGRWITSDTVFTLCTNLYCSGFIAWKIWRINSQTRKYGGQNLTSVLAIVAESAAIYTTWTIFFFLTYQLRSDLQFITIDCLAAFSGISLMLINVRVGLGWTRKAHGESSGQMASVGGGYGHGARIGASGGLGADSFVMRPVAVTIDRVVDTKEDEYTAGVPHYSYGKPEMA